MTDASPNPPAVEADAKVAPGIAANLVGRNLRTSFALVQREFGAYFKSTTAYLVMFFFYLASGWIFSLIFTSLNAVNAPPAEYPMQSWFGMVLFALTVIAPAITMRLFAEEVKTGTLEPLATAPVTDFQIVLSKYLAALAFFIILLLPTIIYAFILVNTSEARAPDRGPMVAGYIGLFFLGMYFLAIGTFASSCTGNQIVAFIGAFMGILMLQMVFFIRRNITDEWWQEVLKPFDFFENFMDFGRGVVDTRHIVYYMSASAVFLAGSMGMLQWRKWKN